MLMVAPDSHRPPRQPDISVAAYNSGHPDEVPGQWPEDSVTRVASEDIGLQCLKERTKDIVSGCAECSTAESTPSSLHQELRSLMMDFEARLLQLLGHDLGLSHTTSAHLGHLMHPSSYNLLSTNVMSGQIMSGQIMTGPMMSNSFTPKRTTSTNSDYVTEGSISSQLQVSPWGRSESHSSTVTRSTFEEFCPVSAPLVVLQRTFKSWRKYTKAQLKARNPAAYSSTKTNASSSPHRLSLVNGARVSTSRPTLAFQPLELLPMWRKEGEDFQSQVSDTVEGMSHCTMDGSRSRQLLMKRSVHAEWKHDYLWPLCVWEFVGFVFIVYDVIATPLMVFDAPVFVSCGVKSLSTAVYWTVSMLLAFGSSYQVDGRLEKECRKTAPHYLKTWFPVDLPLVILDWVICYLRLRGSVFSKTITHSLRYVQALPRGIRLYRLGKLSNFCNHIVDQVTSELLLTIKSLATTTLLIVVITHFIACGWYHIAIALEDNGDDVQTWARANFEPTHGVGYRYTTSLHWAITQFTPASMEVYPTNTMERGYTICTVIFAMVVFSSFVSSMTQAMMHLREVDKKQKEQHRALRHYLAENNISTETSTRVWQYLAQSRTLRKKRQLAWQDVELFSTIPDVLQVAIRFEVYMPFLVAHPFFKLLQESCPPAMRDICQKAVLELPLLPGQELFNWGSPAARMYFVTQGTLHYQEKTHGGYDGMVSRTVTEGQWASEAALWAAWFHRGVMVAKTNCLVLAVEASTVHSILEQYSDVLPSCCCYAQLFVQAMNEPGLPLCDLVDDVATLVFNSAKAFMTGCSSSGTGSFNHVSDSVTLNWLGNLRSALGHPFSGMRHGGALIL